MFKKNSAAKRRERKKKMMAKVVAEGAEFDQLRGNSAATKEYKYHYNKVRAALA